MQFNNEISINEGGDGRFVDSREIKKSPNGIKVRLFGDAQMGYSYFKQDGDKIKVVRSLDIPTMEGATEGFQGAEQKPTKNLYAVAWNYTTEAPCLLTLDKVALISAIRKVALDKDLADATDYDFKLSYDANAKPQDMYSVVRLDKTPLTADQKKGLKAFAETVDLAAYASGDDF